MCGWFINGVGVHHEVRDAVPVHIPRPGNRPAESVPGRSPRHLEEGKAVQTRKDAGSARVDSVGGEARLADEDLGKPVSVQISDRGHRESRPVPRHAPAMGVEVVLAQPRSRPIIASTRPSSFRNS